MGAAPFFDYGWCVRMMTSLLAGVLVTVAVGWPAGLLLFGAAWGKAHGGGPSDLAFSVMLVGALLVPSALGGLSGWMTYRLMGKKSRQSNPPDPRSNSMR